MTQNSANSADTKSLSTLVTAAYEKTELLQEAEYAQAVRSTIDLLDQGLIRVAQKADGAWQVNEWVIWIQNGFSITFLLRRHGPDQPCACT